MRKKLREEVEGARAALNQESVDDALQFIVDAHEKFHLFQGHRIRVWNQREALEQLMKRMEAKCLETKMNSEYCILTADYKMKFDEMRQRESSANFFGKRGISWHIADISYCVWDPESEKAIWLHATLSQILESENKQDGLAVLSLMEAMMKKVSKIPHLKYAYLRTDSAGCYHKKELTLGIPLLKSKSARLPTRRPKTGKRANATAMAQQRLAIARDVWHVETMRRNIIRFVRPCSWHRHLLKGEACRIRESSS
jgi:hypothetical protein